MRFFYACFVVLVFVVQAPAQASSLKEARERWLRGNYEEARELYEKLAKNPGQRDAAAVGISRTWQNTGDYDKALAGIDTALETGAKSPELHARRAELLYVRGRWDEAEKATDQALQVDKENFAARWVRAQIFRDRGDFKKADAEFRWFVRAYTERSDKDMDIKDPDVLQLVGLAGCENARWNNLSDQYQFVLSDVYGDALKQEKSYWPAEYEAGALLLEKYNRGEALAAFDKALSINPRAAEPYVGKGIAALQKLDIKEAEQFAERALKANPNLVEALMLRADVHLAVGSIDNAVKELEAARKVNPRAEANLGRLAACALLQRKPDVFAKLAEEVQRYDAKPGLFYQVVGERLEERRWYDDAENYYKKASELRPMLVTPRNSLGLLYMRIGREEEARKILTKSFADDQFNVRVDNMLKVLRHLDGYKALRTEHFVLKYDPNADEILAQFMANYLEAIYADLAKKFNHQPAGPILVEVFNKHEMFSGRTIALPDLHTIGACTGRMIAMASPRGKDIKQPFNWARVLRHELVHIFNLDQTRYLVPHWLTEGLAVNNEGFPRSQQWSELLLERVPKGELMNLDTIDLGFIRPRTPLDWHMAYCQSQLYVNFLQEKGSSSALGEMLKAYADGLSTESALERVCKSTKADFEKGYLEYVQRVVREMKGKPPKKVMSFRDVRDAYEKNPSNDDLAARYAEFQLKRDPRLAKKLSDSVLSKQKNHPRATYVRSQLLHNAGDDEQALKILEDALDPKDPDTKVLEALGRLYFEAKQFDKAADLFEKAQRAEPYDSKWLVELARVHAQNEDTNKLIETLKELVPYDPDDIGQRKRLARLLLDAGRHAEAEKYARQALEIDVLDVEAEQCLADSLVFQKNFKPAIDTLQLVIKLRDHAKAPDKANDARLQLAQALYGDGQKERALAELTQVLARDPENEAANRLRNEINK